MELVSQLVSQSVSQSVSNLIYLRSDDIAIEKSGRHKKYEPFLIVPSQFSFSSES
jgi:hypothetical protein